MYKRLKSVNDKLWTERYSRKARYWRCVTEQIWDKMEYIKSYFFFSLFSFFSIILFIFLNKLQNWRNSKTYCILYDVYFKRNFSAVIIPETGLLQVDFDFLSHVPIKNCASSMIFKASSNNSILTEKHRLFRYYFLLTTV